MFEYHNRSITDSLPITNSLITEVFVAQLSPGESAGGLGGWRVRASDAALRLRRKLRRTEWAAPQVRLGCRLLLRVQISEVPAEHRRRTDFLFDDGSRGNCRRLHELSDAVECCMHCCCLVRACAPPGPLACSVKFVHYLRRSVHPELR